MGVGSKSDIRSQMSPITLAPAVKNPWRNPMLRNVVSPAVVPAADTNYQYGAALTSTGDPAGATDFTSLAATVGKYGTVMTPWTVTPGSRTINSLRVKWVAADATKVASSYISVWRAVGSNYELVAISGDCGPASGAAYEITTLTPASPLSVTVADDGYTYYIGVTVVYAATASTTFKVGYGDNASLTYTVWTTIPAATWAGVGTTIANTSADGVYVASTARLALLEVDYDSDQLTEMDITTSIVGIRYVPQPVDVPYVIKATDLNVADGEALVWYLASGDQDGGLGTLNGAGEVDCGNTIAGENHIIFSGSDTEIADIGGTGIEGTDLDFYLLFGASDQTKKSCGWVIKELYDTYAGTFHQHQAVTSGSRNQSTAHTANIDRIIWLSGTVTIGRLQVGTNPIITIGDSQTCRSNPAEPLTTRWGGIINQLAKERIWFVGGMGGGLVSEWGTTWFASSTPGEGDLIELANMGLGCLWAFCGYGINDISNATTVDDADSKEIASAIVSYMANYIEQIQAKKTESIVLAGLPPYSNAYPKADQYEAEAVRRVNRGYLGLALANQIPFYNAWPDLVYNPAFGWEEITVANSGFEDDTAGDFDNWTENPRTGSIAANTTQYLVGTQSIKLTTGGAGSVAEVYTAPADLITVPSSTRCKLSLSTYAHDSKAGLIGIYDVTNAAYIVGPFNALSNTSAAWVKEDIEFTTPAGCEQIQIFLQSSLTAAAAISFDNLVLQKFVSGGGVYDFNDSYTDDGGTHIDGSDTGAGGTLVSTKLAAAIESGTIDLRDAWN